MTVRIRVKNMAKYDIVTDKADYMENRLEEVAGQGEMAGRREIDVMDSNYDGHDAAARLAGEGQRSTKRACDSLRLGLG